MTELKTLAQQMPVPEWLPVWIDPTWVQALQAMLMSSIDLIASGFPYFSAAAGWLVPVIWAVWAAGALVLLLLAGGGHFLLGVLRSGDLADFAARLPRGVAMPDMVRLSVAGRYFLASVRARYGQATTRMQVLLDRQKAWPEIVWQKLL